MEAITTIYNITHEQLELLVGIAAMDEALPEGEKLYIGSVKNFSRFNVPKRPVSIEFMNAFMGLAQGGYINIDSTSYNQEIYQVVIPSYAKVWMTVKGDNLMAELEGVYEQMK